jgi:hypothetical protein
LVENSFLETRATINPNVRLDIVVYPVIPAMLEGRWRSEASLGKSVRPYLINKLKVKGLGAWLK